MPRNGCLETIINTTVHLLNLTDNTECLLTMYIIICDLRTLKMLIACESLQLYT